jgi:hypothetical protein
MNDEIKQKTAELPLKVFSGSPFDSTNTITENADIVNTKEI